MTSQAIAALIVGATITVAVGAEDATAPWSTGLPRVEATKTEVGAGQYLWGGALLLAVPDKFQRYWPDYGYRWSNATYIELCGGTAKRNEVESEKLGRVRLVAESGDEAQRLIGVELQRQRRGTENEAERSPESENGDTGFTVEQLCNLLEDDAGRQRAESMVRLMAGTGINLLTTGKWEKNIELSQETDPKLAEYILLWMGSGVHEGVDVANKVSWKAKGKPVVIWDYPTVVKWHTGNLRDTKEVVAFHEEPGYVLTKTRGMREAEAIEQAMSFEVTKGVIDSGFIANTKSQGVDIEIGILGFWANVSNYLQTIDPTTLKLWLVTENAIPIGSLKAEIRVGEKK